jgi:tRNA nucleotidyltransferase (CCA-adding enzyme)
VRERETHVLVVSLARPQAVDDILYPQLRKAERALREEAERLGFDAVGSASAAGERELKIVLELGSALRPAVRRQAGPPPGIDRAGDFLRKWVAAPTLQGPFVRSDGRLAVETLRAERRAEPLLADALPRLPLGRDIRVPEDASAAVVPLFEAEDEPALRAALAELLEKRLPWVRADADDGGRPRA